MLGMLKKQGVFRYDTYKYQYVLTLFVHLSWQRELFLV